MVWTTPVTWTADQLVKASDMNEQLRDNMTILKIAVDDDGRITAIDSTRFASLDGSNLTGVGRLTQVNSWTAKNDFTGAGRLVLPIGADLWAT